MTGTHSTLSPSGASRWMACPGSTVLEEPLEDTSSTFADEGTVAHWLAAWAFDTGTDNVIDYMTLYPEGTHTCMDDDGALLPQRITADMCKYVQVHVDYVRREAGEDADVEIEQRVHYDEIIETPDQSGTADAIILRDDSFTITDLKYGMGVQVYAPDNKQLMLYALGVLQDYGHLADFKTAKMVITQPRLDHIDEHTMTVDELLAFGAEAKAAAANTVRAGLNALERPADDSSAQAWQDAWNETYLNPGEDQCRWCKAKATCPSLRAYIADATGADWEALSQGMEDLTVPDASAPVELGQAMSKVKLIEEWVKAVRAEVEKALFAGIDVEGWKVVQGRRSPRSWTSEEDAQTLLKSKFRLKVEQMFDMKLISPTKAEALLKDSPKRWKQVEKLIEQKDGKPSVAPASDKRPAISVTPTADGMEDLSAPAEGMPEMLDGFMADLLG